MRSQTVRLFQTLPHDCGYFADRTAQNLVIDPAAPNLAQVYDNALTRGYRRAGNHVYMPRCAACNACTPVRVPVTMFKPNRSQRRCLALNTDVQMAITKAGYSDERFALYQRYLSSRHSGGGMDDATPDDFEKFLYTDWSPTCFIEFRLDATLIAVAVTDACSNGLSAVYSWFDPDLLGRSLGTLAILSQITLARANKLDHLYLGFWIAGHPKMDYKARYRPLEALRNGVWQPLQAQSNP
ncbi:MAG: arginyltransferase [Dokdonella sp.]